MFALGFDVLYRCVRCRKQRDVDLERAKRIMSGDRVLMVRLKTACSCGERRVKLVFLIDDDADEEDDGPGPKAG